MSSSVLHQTSVYFLLLLYFIIIAHMDLYHHPELEFDGYLGLFKLDFTLNEDPIL